MGTRNRFTSACVRASFAFASSVAAPAAMADPPPPAAMRIGDITFHYSPLSWRIVADGDGAMATCVQHDCSGVVIDIEHGASDGTCTTDAVRETAQRLFPRADRHAVNSFPAGPFALVMSESRFGPDFDVPTYVFACFDWQDHDYRFTARPETVGDKSWTGGALHYLVSRASAPPARIDMLRVGEMTLDIPTDIWRVSVAEPGRLAWLTCRAPTCRDGGDALIFVSAQTGGAELATPPTLDTRGWIGGAMTTEIQEGEIVGERPGALPFSITTIQSGCRNYVPPQVIATARHGDTTYRIATPGGRGCRSGGWGVPDAAFDNLVRSARIVPDDPR